MTERKTSKSARVIPLRPKVRPVHIVSSVPVPVAFLTDLPMVVVEWDGVRAMNVAVCLRCVESMTAVLAGAAYEWAETHECDPELVEILAEIDDETAA